MGTAHHFSIFIGGRCPPYLADCNDIILEFSNVAGGPGENISAFIKFKTICFLNLPMIIDAVTGIYKCNYHDAKILLPNEYIAGGKIDQAEFDEYGLTLIRFLNEGVFLPYFILSYGYELFIEE